MWNFNKHYLGMPPRNQACKIILNKKVNVKIVTRKVFLITCNASLVNIMYHLLVGYLVQMNHLWLRYAHILGFYGQLEASSIQFF